jgi:hypothetical protein
MELSPEQGTQVDSVKKQDSIDKNRMEVFSPENILQVASRLPELLSMIFSRRLSPSMSHEINAFLQQFKQKFPRVSEALSDLQRAKSKPERNLAWYRLIDVLVESFMPDIPVGVNAFATFIRRLDALADLPVDLGHLKTTSYMDCRQVLLGLARKAYTSGLASKTQKYLGTVDNYPEDMLAICQSLTTKSLRDYKLLANPRKRYTKKMTEHCLDFYSEFAGQFEKGISIVAGLIEIQQGLDPNYIQIRKRGLRTNVKVVQNSSCAILANCLDVQMRNAIAHRSFIFNPIRRMVEFNDRGKRFTSGYREINRKTLELSAASLALNQLRFMLTIEQLRSFKDALSNSQSVEPIANTDSI